MLCFAERRVLVLNSDFLLTNQTHFSPLKEDDLNVALLF